MIHYCLEEQDEDQDDQDQCSYTYIHASNLLLYGSDYGGIDLLVVDLTQPATKEAAHKRRRDEHGAGDYGFGGQVFNVELSHPIGQTLLVESVVLGPHPRA